MAIVEGAGGAAAIVEGRRRRPPKWGVKKGRRRRPDGLMHINGWCPDDDSAFPSAEGQGGILVLTPLCRAVLLSGRQQQPIQPTSTSSFLLCDGNGVAVSGLVISRHGSHHDEKRYRDRALVGFSSRLLFLGQESAAGESQ